MPTPFNVDPPQGQTTGGEEFYLRDGDFDTGSESDDFNDGAVDGGKWATVGSGSVVEAGNVLTVETSSGSDTTGVEALFQQSPAKVSARTLSFVLSNGDQAGLWLQHENHVDSYAFLGPYRDSEGVYHLLAEVVIRGNVVVSALFENIAIPNEPFEHQLGIIRVANRIIFVLDNARILLDTATWEPSAAANGALLVRKMSGGSASQCVFDEFVQESLVFFGASPVVFSNPVGTSIVFGRTPSARRTGVATVSVPYPEGVDQEFTYEGPTAVVGSPALGYQLQALGEPSILEDA